MSSRVITTTTSRASARRSQLIVAALGAITGTVVLAYATAAGSTLARLNDFYREALPAYSALEHGHLLGFLRLGPAYVGSLILRAPFALVPAIWGGGPRDVYFASALPCMLALIGLCTWLAARPRRGGVVTWASRLSPMACAVFSPLILVALFGGHPEEVLGGVLCVGAVILAVKGRAGLAGLLVGLAVVNKSWALVAVPVVLAVLPAERRRSLLVMGAAAAGILIPTLLVRVHGFSSAATGAQVGTSIFNPAQLLWWLGARSWVVSEARPLIVFVATACCGWWWAQRARAATSRVEMSDALLLLALVLLLRCALDPWDNLYYHVPFLLALLAYDVCRGRMPLLTILYMLALLAIVPPHGVPPMSPDLRAATYTVLVIVSLGWMIARLYFPAASWAHWPAGARNRLKRRRPTRGVPADGVPVG